MNNNHSQQPNKVEKNVVSVVGNKDSGSNRHTNSYIHAVKRGTQFHNVVKDNKPAIVLDESCLNQKDYSTAVMGKVKENIKLRYMGGYWVMIEFLNKDSKNKFNTNVGTRSWFSHLQQASSTFHIDERVTWVDIEEKREEVNSEEGDVEEVSETIFEKEQDQVPKEENFNIGENGCNLEDPFNIYGLLNKKQKNLNDGTKSNDTMKYPLGFTPMKNADSQSNDHKGVGKEGDETLKKDQEEKQNSEVRKPSSINNSKEDTEESICSGHFKKIDKPHSGGSFPQFMEDLVKVGQAIRYNMKGCLKNIEEIIGSLVANDNHR
ncbi:hypothetical protein Tco_0654357 [Tanacetum coccineum]|uniref:Nucleotide-binding alpha-beta plait domain-containing protein n=1 Tax=Tanacetum coccineum TaxID=301880 RepID=A0ABQ4X3H2_9ASTR